MLENKNCLFDKILVRITITGQIWKDLFFIPCVKNRILFPYFPGVEHRLQLSESMQKDLENAIRGLNSERSQLTEQISTVVRQKNALAEEVVSLRGESERYSIIEEQLVSEKEQLAKDRAELVTRVSLLERDNSQLNEARFGNLCITGSTLFQSGYLINSTPDLFQINRGSCMVLRLIVLVKNFFA